MGNTKIAPGVTTVPSKIAIGGGDWAELIQPGTFPRYSGSRQTGVTCSRSFIFENSRLSEFGDEVLPAGAPGLHPDIPRLYVDDFTIDPFGDGNTDWYQNDQGFTEAGLWQATVNYRTLTIDVIDGQDDDNLGGAFLWESSIDITSETATLPGHSFTWLDAGGTPEARRVPDAVTFPAILPVTNLTIEVPRVAVVPWAAIEAANGKLNASAYARQPAQTLMYMGASVKVQRAFNGAITFGLTHRFKRRSIGWNFFWNPVAQAWRRTTPAVYATSSFTGLIPGVT